LHLVWIPLALLSALCAASSTFVLKRAVHDGGAMRSTIAFRVVAGFLLAALLAATGPLPTLTPAYWRAAALVMPPEIGGMVCFALALRAGDLSLVQPLVGMLPLFVMAWGVVFLGEVPTATAAGGIVLIVAGVYAVGLRPGASPLEPVRALVRSRAGWYAIAAAACWSVATIVHKLGIAQVGPIAWAVTLTLGSAVTLWLLRALVAWRRRTAAEPPAPPSWIRLILVAGALLAVQQVGLHRALGAAQAGYVSALTTTSSLLATVLGIVFLGERGAARARVLAALLVTAGGVLIALGA
jgi:drug/metabolite transporter (DMT)-like permease